MNHVELSNKIQHFAIRRDIPGLTTLKADMKTEIERLDRWFNKYLQILKHGRFIILRWLSMKRYLIVLHLLTTT